MLNQPIVSRIIKKPVIKYSQEVINMQNKKQIIRNIIILLLLILITFIFIFKNYGFINTIKIIMKTDIIYILLAIITMLLYIIFESINIKNIIKSLGNHIPIINAIKYTFIGFFFSGITPGGSGGQPMEIYYMKKDNIPVTSSTIALLIELISFHTITIICGLIGLIMNKQLMTKELIWIFIIGLVLKLIVLTIMIISLFFKNISQLLINLTIKILHKFKYINLNKLEKNLNESLIKYHESSIYIKHHKRIIVKSLLTVFFQVIMSYTIPYFIYRSFGLNEFSYLKILSIQALLYVTTSSLPLPGTVGISENVFLKIYATVFTVTILPSAMILSRGINYYLFMLISIVIVILNSLPKNKKKYDIIKS